MPPAPHAPQCSCAAQSDPQAETQIGDPIRVRVPSEMLEIIPTYLGSLRRAASEMRRALEAGMVELILRKAHQMKGEGAAFGFEEISTLGKLLQQAAAQQDGPALSKGLDRLDDYLARVVAIGK